MTSSERYWLRQDFPLHYQDYCASGGCLEEEFFSLSFDFLANGRNLKQPANRAYFRAGRNYAQRAGIEKLKEEQEQLYAYLREMMPPASSSNGHEGCPWRLCDQVLLAQVFLLTGDQEVYEQFTRSFPNIFPEAFDPEK